MTTTHKLSPREIRRDNTSWFTCCGDTVRHDMWWLSQIRCPHCGEIVEAGDHPDDEIEFQEAAE